MSALLEQISEARVFLDKAEKTLDPNAKRLLVESALELFDDCMESEPTENELIRIKNIKKAFTRTLVNQIPKLNLENSDTFSFFLFVLMFKFAKETKELCESDSKFITKLEWIKEQYSGELNDVVRLITK
jgi:hypothetical protein